MIRPATILRFGLLVVGACALVLVLSTRTARPAGAAELSVASVTAPVEQVTETVTKTVAPVTKAVEQPGQNVTTRAADPVDAVAQPVRKTTAPVVAKVAPVVEPVGKVVLPVTQVVAPVVEPVRDVVAPAVEQVAPVVEPVREAVEPVTKSVAPVLRPVADVVAPVAPVAQPVLGVAAPVADTVGPVVQQVLDVTAPVTDPVAPVVRPVLDTGTRLLRPVIDATPLVPASPFSDAPTSPPSAPSGAPVPVDVEGSPDPQPPATTHDNPAHVGPSVRVPVTVTSTVVAVVSSARTVVEAVAEPFLRVMRTPARVLAHAPRPHLPMSLPGLPATHELPSPGAGDTIPGSLAVLVAAAAAASLVARRLRFATAVRPSLLFASSIERPG